ncbi:hypothetical protein ND856_18835 [Leptospira bandrabouensis]|uniref:hypothetical protein n=1 Tax=Leptospira bandrabouensis TaxID=2484903 RepID=UPI00223CD006|nr:hypothetical protein [Leptospira bandrabouensis]MCW7479363.1 hypothetical protein [Leptospira bandrabouensis]MCW7487057.1 hypothetical protein [Leptospira bandrabouensis]
MTTLQNKLRNQKEDLLQNSNKFNWSAVGAIATVISILIAAISIFMQLSSKKRELKAEVLYIQKLNILGSDDELKAVFTYKKKEVVDPYRIGVRLSNSGEVTLLSKGDNRNVISDGIRLWLSKSYQIIKVIPESCDLPMEIKVLSYDTLSLNFQQWKVAEYCSFSIYVTGVVKSGQIPKIELRERDIHEGIVSVEDSSGRPSEEKYKRFIDKILGKYAFAFSIFAFVILIAIAILIVTFLFVSVVEVARNKIWKMSQYKAFEYFLESDEMKIPNKEKSIYLENPKLVPDEIWEKFKGTRIPIVNPSFESTAEMLKYGFTIVVLALSIFLALLSLLYA